MRVKSTVDVRFKLFVFAVIGIMTALSVCLSQSLMLSPQQALVGYAAVVLASGLLLWLLYGTYYELRDNDLLCRCGPFVEIIPYYCIRQLELSDNMFSSLALSARRIVIEQSDDDRTMEITMISPQSRELFLARLKQRCYNLDYVA